jgi:hypothetical protein
MTKRIIFGVGLNLPEVEGLECIDVDSDRSLLDADIVVFYPKLLGVAFADTYNGKPRLSDHYSFLMKEKIGHWRTQMLSAFESGKTLVVFMPEKQDAYRFTGEKTHSGTGRSRVTTNIVAPISNYELLPITFNSMMSGEGKAMKLVPGADVLSAYWKDFGGISRYNVSFESKLATTMIETRTGGKTVGALVARKGHFLLLPDLEWDQEGSVRKERMGRSTGPKRLTNFLLAFEMLFWESMLLFEAKQP